MLLRRKSHDWRKPGNSAATDRNYLIGQSIVNRETVTKKRRFSD